MLTLGSGCDLPVIPAVSRLALVLEHLNTLKEPIF